MKNTIIKPVATIFNDFKEKFGIPRQSGRAPSVLSRIVFTPEFRDIDAVRGIEGFSHLWLIFDFSLSHRTSFTPLVRPPRLGGNQKIGVFASRSPFRPNSLGLSSVKLLRVEQTKDGPTLIVSGADLLNGTPIFDIKPYIPFTDCHSDAIGGFADNECNHKLCVQFLNGSENFVSKDKLTALTECLADDPRPSYQDDGRIYGLAFADYNVKFKVESHTLFVLEVQPSN